MYRKDIIIMSREEVRRLQLVRKVIDGELKQVRVAEALGISGRQVRRIVKRVKVEGDEGVIHRLRGVKSNRRYSDEIRRRIINICREKYEGFGPTLAREKLEEINGIKISDETLRKLMMESGLWQKGWRRRKHRMWRERKERYGEMVQMDGSQHDWLEGRGPKLVLMGYIDDATSKVYGRFYLYEGTIPALDSFKHYIKKVGIPHSVYLDRHKTYRATASPTIEEELAGEKPLSQFERALKELGVEVIHANSPQAKGRVERLFRTFQDRVIKELRLSGIKTIEEANAFLEEYLQVYNNRFSVLAKYEGNMHRKVLPHTKLEHVLCIKEERIIRNDYTVSYNRKLYQILESTKARKVIVEEHLDGSIRLCYNNEKLPCKEILYRPLHKEANRARKQKEAGYARAGKQWIPPKEHPWRKPYKNMASYVQY